MPIPVGVGAVQPQQPGGPIAEPVFITRAAWIDPSGVRWELTDLDAPWLTTDSGVAGIGSVPRSFTTDDMIRGGTQVRNISIGARTITWPMVVGGDMYKPGEFLAAVRQIGRAFTMTRWAGMGTLRIERSDGTAREIKAYYQEGFDTSGSSGMYINADTFTLTLYCPDPFWYGDLVTYERHYIESTLDFQDPYISVGAASTLGPSTVNNDGDVECYPDWVIHGPANEVTATNNTTGDTFTVKIADIIGRTLEAGETVTITGYPPKITGPTPAIGKSWKQAIDWKTMKLWYLLPGLNDVDFGIDGQAAGSAIEMNLRLRYESA
jgi:hypothetical protein